VTSDHPGASKSLKKPAYRRSPGSPNEVSIHTVPPTRSRQARGDCLPLEPTERQGEDLRHGPRGARVTPTVACRLYAIDFGLAHTSGANGRSVGCSRWPCCQNSYRPHLNATNRLARMGLLVRRGEPVPVAAVVSRPRLLWVGDEEGGLPSILGGDTASTPPGRAGTAASRGRSSRRSRNPERPAATARCALRQLGR